MQDIQLIMLGCLAFVSILVANVFANGAIKAGKWGLHETAMRRLIGAWGMVVIACVFIAACIVVMGQ